jgi:hypothetical protein
LTNLRQYQISILILFFILSLGEVAFSQVDSTKKMIFTDSAVIVRPADSLAKVAPPVNNEKKVDSILKHHSPKKAAIRSAILPGWGQVYNKKYWKVPIVYGALGISGGVFIYNLQWYRRTGYAFTVAYNRDTGNYNNVFPELQYLVTSGQTNALRSYRDEFRRQIDYSAIIFLLLWGLNVVDATVDAHLKPFDVTPDLSLRLKFGPSQMSGTTGLSLVLAFK